MNIPWDEKDRRRANGKPEPATREYLGFNMETVLYSEPVQCEYPFRPPHMATEGELAYPCTSHDTIFYCYDCIEYEKKIWAEFYANEEIK